jgi:predicted transcriptional regulator
LSAALKYAERNIPVFPLRPGGKKPAIPKSKGGRGYLDATTDPDQIRRWWTRWPNANIGIPTGERTGLLVLDVDAEKNGFTSLDALEKKHEPLPETTTVKTGGGGMHVYLDYPTGSGIRNSTGQVGAGLDMRGEGGYVVAPPSRTHKGPYAVLNRFPRAAPPKWLLETVREPYSAPEGKDNSERYPVSATLEGEPIPEGQRNDTLTRVGGKLRARGLELEGLGAELLAVNAARCSPPLEVSEVAGIAQSVCRYPAGDASPEPTPEVLRNIEALFSGVLERLEWTGRGGPTDRAVYAALLITARRYGRPSRGGVKVYLSVRALALAAGTSKKTAGNALDRLRVQKLVYRASEGRGTKAGALILRVSEATQEVDTQPFRGVSTDSGLLLRSHLRELLRLRWGTGRLGKFRALLLEVIARTGSITLSELSERTGRRRYDVRRSLRLLKTRALVECSGDTCRLVPEFASALDRELEASGIKRSERLDKEKYERQREAYRDHRTRLRNGLSKLQPSTGRVVVRGTQPDWHIEDLERVEVFVPEQPEQPPADTEPSTVGVVSSVSGVFDMAREHFGLPDPEPSDSEPPPDKDSPSAFLRSELRGVTAMRYREMLRRWKDLGGKPEVLEGAIRSGPYRFKREPVDFNQPYVYPALTLVESGAA